MPLDKNVWSEPYAFCGDPHKIFYEFFGGDNPFAGERDRIKDFFEGYSFNCCYFLDFTYYAELEKAENFGGLVGRGQKKQDAPVERDLMLSLEEVYHGCIKKMRNSRRVMNDDGISSSYRDKILTVTVKRGWLAGTRITFEREGNQGPNSIPADIVFVLKDKPHNLYRREGPHLIYVEKIPLVKALTGSTIHVPTLDGRLLDIPITDLVK